MYRRGIPASKIAALDGSAVTTVRYHLQVAAKQNPEIRTEHAATLPVKLPDPTETGLRNMQDVISFFEAQGRLPTTGGKSPRERSLGVWLHRRRREAAEGTLSPTFRDGLGVIPGWDQPSPWKADNEARWQKRLQEVKALRAAGGEWPRHQKTQNVQERTLGVWLHVQRINYNQGSLAPAKEKLLNKVLPGWRQGRRRGRPDPTPRPGS